MKFEIEHTYPITPAAYEALHFDEPFNIALARELGLGRTLVRLDRSVDRIVRHVRCVPVADERGTFVEELDYDVARAHGQWRTLPTMRPDRVHMSGSVALVAASGGTRRIVRGEVRVSVFAIGRLIERHIVAAIEKSYAAAARFTTDWIAGSRPAALDLGDVEHHGEEARVAGTARNREP
jgi:hypothetical protein